MKKRIFAIGMAVMLCFQAALAAGAPAVKIDPADGSIRISGKADKSGNVTITVFNEKFSSGDKTTEDDFEQDSKEFYQLSDDKKPGSVDWVKQVKSDDGSYDVSYISQGSMGRYAVKVADSKGAVSYEYFTFLKESDYPTVLEEINSVNDTADMLDFIDYYRNVFFELEEYDTLSDEAKELVASGIIKDADEDGYGSLDDAVKSFKINVYVQSFYEASDAESAMKIVNDNMALLGVDDLDANYAKSNDTYKEKICDYILDEGSGDYEAWCKAFKKAAEANKPADTSSKSDKSSGNKGGSVSGFKADNSLVADTAVVQTALYEDIEPEHWAYESIYRLTTRGILSGDDTGRYRPDDSVTRAEFLKIILNTLKLSDADAQCSFDDVAPDAWYYPYVATAAGIEIVAGVGNNCFNPEASITRQDAVKIMYNAALFKNTILKEVREYSEFTDAAHISDYALPAVKMFYSAEIINGYNDGSFAPLGNVTRAEAAKMAFSFLQNEN